MRMYNLYNELLITEEKLENIFSVLNTKSLYEKLLRELDNNNEFDDLYQLGKEKYDKSLMSLEMPFPYSREEVNNLLETIIKLQTLAIAIQLVIELNCSLNDAIEEVLKNCKVRLKETMINDYNNHIKNLVNPIRIFKK